MSEKGGLTINTEKEVTYTQKEKGYVISQRDWKRIKVSLEKLHRPKVVWSNIAWASLGLSSSGLVSWISSKESIVPLILSILFFGVTICSFFAAQSEKKYNNSSIDSIKEVINEIEETLVPNNQNTEYGELGGP